MFEFTSMIGLNYWIKLSFPLTLLILMSRMHLFFFLFFIVFNLLQLTLKLNHLSLIVPLVEQEVLDIRLTLHLALINLLVLIGYLEVYWRSELVSILWIKKFRGHCAAFGSISEGLADSNYSFSSFPSTVDVRQTALVSTYCVIESHSWEFNDICLFGLGSSKHRGRLKISWPALRLLHHDSLFVNDASHSGMEPSNIVFVSHLAHLLRVLVVEEVTFRPNCAFYYKIMSNLLISSRGSIPNFLQASRVDGESVSTF